MIRKRTFTPWLLMAVTSASAESIVQQAAAVCVEQAATPVHIPDEENPAYCACEAQVWAERGTENDLRAAMVYTTGDQKHMNGAPYSADAALDFIVAHATEVEKRCAG